eukprot:CAMPEP_0172169246 /NCGR_PEP_ID=MMETSP1050-20130122/10600_1 /TAXON_ID=233186 /ORGANISM="Cryptomonas curvata, Strain CCAP979/52" /LENGTH=315 /DNA_ID=CAMNT_0012840285 /DNA_START=71 /DNA_END=1015 /DNA_ORIENTATION=-
MGYATLHVQKIHETTKNASARQRQRHPEAATQLSPIENDTPCSISSRSRFNDRRAQINRREQPSSDSPQSRRYRECDHLSGQSDSPQSRAKTDVPRTQPHREATMDANSKNGAEVEAHRRRMISETRARVERAAVKRQEIEREEQRRQQSAIEGRRAALNVDHQNLRRKEFLDGKKGILSNSNKEQDEARLGNEKRGPEQNDSSQILCRFAGKKTESFFPQQLSIRHISGNVSNVREYGSTACASEKTGGMDTGEGGIKQLGARAYTAGVVARARADLADAAKERAQTVWEKRRSKVDVGVVLPKLASCKAPAEK